MDLIGPLPSTQSGHDAIVVFVDRLTKMIHAEPITLSVTAPELAKLFYSRIVRYHGLPKVIVSDRDPRFTSEFWSTLFVITGTKLAMSTANYAPTDGQTERANRTVLDMLRSFVSPHQNDWDDLLPLVEFAYNSAVNASTGYTPFFLNYGFEPHTPLSLAVPVSTDAAPKDASAEAFVQRMKKHLEEAKASIRDAQVAQAKTLKPTQT